ncbi:glycosyltransferase [Kitasatospora aureofaciens]|uniref:Glycosyl transferase family 2 n=1 Tax=Kitasatospora aureofaciens TaxID=1894 RepID=A0A8H9I0A5_KITAU|nr:glycosyltransferase [Kitasatospora aureofaciens]UKZ04668.1 glycosyltransferase [Streptomyces viridifaciens]GGU99844.1 glycosyl transferase family 2 [Kitasatospora aureofaciens]
MTVLLWIAAFSLLVWLWLACCHGLFWRTDVRLPPRRPPVRWPRVVVVVPARDEAAVLPVSLPTLLAQKYPGRARVILVDDHSADGTGALAAELRTMDGLELTVTSPPPLPPGWTGKLWALRHGVELAGTDAEYLLLTDADIAHGPDSLAELVAAAEGNGLDLVSQMARLRVETGWERLIVPAFVYFFAQLYPFRRSNRPGSRTAAAAGGCSLVRREALERAGGVAAIRGAVIDDVSLARAVKSSGGRTWLGLAGEVDSVRPYPRLEQLWRMVSRSAYAQLRHSPLLLLGTVLGLALVYLVPPVATVAGLVAGAPPVAVAGGAAWALMAGTYLPMVRYYGQPVAAVLLLPFTASLYLLMTVDSAVQHWRGRGAAWKGRTYSGA